MDERTEQINGPINVVRLEGNIGQIKKIIYIFMDTHYSLTMQTTCESIYSEDITRYLATNFKNLNNSDKIYDFFLEIFPTKTQNIANPSNVNFKENYIGELLKFFKKIFVYDPDKNKVSPSKIFKNIRLHYVDIREYFYRTYDLNHAINILNYMWNEHRIDLDGLSTIISSLKFFASHCELILEVFETYKQKNPKKKQIIKSLAPPEEIKEHMEYLLHKIFGVFKHDNIRKIMEKWENTIKKNVKELITNIDKSIELFTKIGNIIHHNNFRITIEKRYIRFPYEYGISQFTMHDMLRDMHLTLDVIYRNYLVIFCWLMATFFLRRFLDKDYVTNAISYTGDWHSQICVGALVKDFNFKITHVSYSKNKDINAVVRKLDYDDLPMEFYPEVMSQCSDMSGFPKNFE